MKAAIIMGSDSDWPVLKPAVDVFKQFGIECEVTVASAHRTPDKVREFVKTAPERGVGVFITAAGMAAHLGGVVASYTTLPVIGVPIDASPLKGMDALLSTVQMPPGIPVATMPLNGAKNAALFAVQIFSLSDKGLQQQYKEYREKLAAEVDKKEANVIAQIKAIAVADEVKGKVTDVANDVVGTVKALFEEGEGKNK